MVALVFITQINKRVSEIQVRVQVNSREETIMVVNLERDRKLLGYDTTSGFNLHTFVEVRL